MEETIHFAISSAYSTSLRLSQLLPSGKAVQPIICPQIQPIFFSSLQPLIPSPLRPLPATSNLSISQPSTHTEKHFSALGWFRGTSRGRMRTWMGGHVRMAGQWIYTSDCSPRMALSARKIQHAVLIPESWPFRSRRSWALSPQGC